jgi:hypothetical protein
MERILVVDRNNCDSENDNWLTTIKYTAVIKGNMWRYTLDLPSDAPQMPVNLAALSPVREQALFHLGASRNLASSEWAFVVDQRALEGRRI